MVDTETRSDRQAGAARLLWSNRRRILASTAALGFAAYLAGAVVPPSHRAEIRVSAAPAVSARWDEAALRDALASAPSGGSAARSGVLAAWADLVDQSAALLPRAGGERAADGSVVFWVEDRDPDAARQAATALAERLIGRSEPIQAAGSVSATPRPAPATDAIDASIASAREALARAEARLAAMPDPAASDAARDRQGADADLRASQAARRELQGLERLARGLGEAAPSDAPAALRQGTEWLAWRDAAVRRDAAAAQVAQLSRTLLDGHPRMATLRLRLADLEGELDAARARFANALDRRIAALRVDEARLDREVAAHDAADGQDARRRAALAAASTEVEAARRTLEALEETRSAIAAADPVEPAPVVAPPEQPPAISTALVETEVRPNIWPIVAGSAVFGFVASSLYAVLSGVRHRAPLASPELVVKGRRRGAVRPEGREATERRVSSARFDVTPADELIGGILASGISRVVIVPIGADERPASVEIVRRLALRGRQGALVDLSERQLAARAMGVPDDSLGISDMIAGDATFAEIARRDFATQAEAFGAGRASIGEAAFLAMERRNVLEFIERNYEVALVICGGLPLETVKALLTPEAALVVTVDGEDEAAIEAGVRRLRGAGLADMILADGRQLTS